jgi:outer membrane lipoprotein carrier protein
MAGAVALAAWAPFLSAQGPALAAYERVADAWRATQTLEVRFEQQVVNALVGRTATSRGVYRQQRPNRVAITFTDPAGDQVVGDGKALWVYLPSSAPGQVLKLPANADGAVVADLLAQLLETPRQSFQVTGGEAVELLGRPARRVSLRPRPGARVPFVRAELWLDDAEPRPLRVQVADPQGVERTITLSSWTTGVRLPAEAFRFTPPRGVRVVTSLPGAP